MRVRSFRHFFHLLFFLSIASCTLKTTSSQDSPLSGTIIPTGVNPVPEIVLNTPQMKPANTATAPTSNKPYFAATPTTFDSRGMPVSTCDQIRIEGDTTIPDGTVLEPDEVFIKAWKVQNSGQCEWSPGYRLVFYQGDALGAPDVVYPYFAPSESAYELVIGTWPPQRFTIKPGEIVDLVILLQAPSQSGSYQGTWALMNEKGERIESVFWVSINVLKNQSIDNADLWAGEWKIKDPSLSSQDLQIRIFERNAAFFSVFYTTHGESNLITAWSGKDPYLVNGEYGAPSQPTGKTLVWAMLPDNKDQFQGINYSDRFKPYPWCGSRPGTPFPEPCLLTPPKSN